VSRLLISAFSLFALAAPVVATLAPRVGDVVLVVMPGAGTGGILHSIGAAGGAIVDAGRNEAIAFARSNDPAFAGRLYAAGAILVVRWDWAGCKWFFNEDRSQ
jgi:hypothetical protein